MKIKEIYNKIDEMANFSIQDNWDNSGLLIGDNEKEVNKILICLDLDINALNRAIKENVGLIITHHPIIFNPLKVIDSDTLVYKLIENNIAVISAHTNMDLAKSGINYELGNLFELKNISPLFLRNMYVEDESYGVIGDLENKMGSQDFFEVIKQKLKNTNIKVSNNFNNKEIKKVAICGGAGSDFIKSAIEKNADIYVTADLKHNHYIDNMNEDIILVDAGHYNTENIFVDILSKKIQEHFPKLEIIMYEREPYKFV